MIESYPVLAANSEQYNAELQGALSSQCLKTHPRPKRPEYQARNIQPRLPISRPRALTLPLPSTAPAPGLFADADAIKQWTSPQATSLLMRLPLKVFMQIYEAVLGHRRVHVAFEFGARVYRTFKKTEVLEWRWWHTIRTWDQTEDDRYRNVWWDRCRTGKVDGVPGPPNGMMGKLKLDFALLLTCRKITTTFNSASHELLHSFQSLVLSRRFAAITSIEQIWTFIERGVPNVRALDKTLYNEMWAILASMLDLRHLKIAIASYEFQDPKPARFQETWLGPLEQLRGKDMEAFELLVPELMLSISIDERSRFKLNTFRDVTLFVCRSGT